MVRLVTSAVAVISVIIGTAVEFTSAFTPISSSAEVYRQRGSLPWLTSSATLRPKETDAPAAPALRASPAPEEVPATVPPAPGLITRLSAHVPPASLNLHRAHAHRAPMPSRPTVPVPAVAPAAALSRPCARAQLARERSDCATCGGM
eukprot:CAMPEP_0181100452 /NCGR_PEP_ID=MMETSP1071-20121207/13203_1 /TAXON_ID=35127 /ORGANISM="Thalassiosira sp., Strain NH16" /LENGTH=147 /DNA_ID=CAMNT_0023183187 /DNA_START=82 /DNA_END=526 /DNA_ORIENTATION=+